MTEEKKPQLIQLDDQTVFFDGRKKNVIVSSKDFPTREDYYKDLVKKKNPELKVIIANWNVIVLREINLKILMRIIGILFFFEKFFIGIKPILKKISPIEIKITEEVITERK